MTEPIQFPDYETPLPTMAGAIRCAAPSVQASGRSYNIKKEGIISQVFMKRFGFELTEAIAKTSCKVLISPSKHETFTYNGKPFVAFAPIETTTEVIDEVHIVTFSSAYKEIEDDEQG